MPEYPAEGLKRLHLATVLQAVEDLRNNPQDESLKTWLLWDAFFILECYEQPIYARKWKEFVLAGCPGKFKMGSK